MGVPLPDEERCVDNYSDNRVLSHHNFEQESDNNRMMVTSVHGEGLNIFENRLDLYDQEIQLQMERK